jgi:hypothetical protein
VVSMNESVHRQHAYADAFCGKTQETSLLCVVEGQALEASEDDGIWMLC